MFQEKQILEGTKEVFNKAIKSEKEYFVKMPSELMNYVHVPGYKPEYNYLYTIIVDYYNVELGYAYPTEWQLARKYGKGVQTVRKHLRFLEKVGLIKITKRGLNKLYIPYKPLGQADLFKACPEARDRYNAIIQAEEAEKERTRSRTTVELEVG